VSALAVLDAERIKLSTTRAPLWSAVGVAVLSLGLAALQAATAYSYDVVAPEQALLGVAVFGVPVLMVLASLTVTGEYRSGLIRATFLAVPRRPVVLVAKAVVAAAFCGLCAALTSVAAILVARATATASAGAR
jgi:ABC-2 type transport system permease protein